MPINAVNRHTHHVNTGGQNFRLIYVCISIHITTPHPTSTAPTLTNSGLQDPPKKLAVCFWHNIVQSEELPYAQYMGLLSSDKAAFEAVHLLSYQRYVNVPRHVTWVDARAIMPHERFLQLYESGKVNFRVEIAPGKKGDAEHSSVVCLLSDFIRLKYAATIRLVNYSRVAVIDCDTIWLRKWDSKGVLGCEFASLCENASSFENFDKLKRKVKFLLKYATEPGDMGKIVPPSNLSRSRQYLRQSMIPYSVCAQTRAYFHQCEIGRSSWTPCSAP